MNRDIFLYPKKSISIIRNFCFCSCYGKFTKMFGYCINYLGLHFFINVQHFIFINIPRYRTLLAVYDAVRYAYVVWITSKLMGYQSFLYSLYHNMADYMHPYRAFNSLRYSTLIPFSICKFFFYSEFISHMMSTNSTSIFNIMNFLLACQR